MLNETVRFGLTVSFLIPPDAMVPFSEGTVPETKMRPFAEVPPAMDQC
jgi:hypothetical protein